MLHEPGASAEVALAGGADGAVDVLLDFVVGPAAMHLGAVHGGANPGGEGRCADATHELVLAAVARVGESGREQRALREDEVGARRLVFSAVPR